MSDVTPNRKVIVLDQYVLDCAKAKAGIQEDQVLCYRARVAPWSFSRARKGLVLPAEDRRRIAKVLGVPEEKLFREIDLSEPSDLVSE